MAMPKATATASASAPAPARSVRRRSESAIVPDNATPGPARLLALLRLISRADRAELKGIGFDRVPVDLVAGDHRRPEHLVVNPQGLVPALEIDRLVLTQSLAILEYLEYLEETRVCAEDPAFVAAHPDRFGPSLQAKFESVTLPAAPEPATGIAEIRTKS